MENKTTNHISVQHTEFRKNDKKVIRNKPEDLIKIVLQLEIREKIHNNVKDNTINFCKA